MAAPAHQYTKLQLCALIEKKRVVFFSPPTNKTSLPTRHSSSFSRKKEFFCCGQQITAVNIFQNFFRIFIQFPHQQQQQKYVKNLKKSVRYHKHINALPKIGK